MSNTNMTSTQSTPSKRGATGAAKPILENIRPHLKDDIEDKLFINMPINKFVQQVWRISPNDIEFIEAKFRDDWVDVKLMDDFRESCDADEVHTYRPFQKIPHALTDVVRKASKKGKEANTTKYWNDKGRYVLQSAASRKPDLIPMHIDIKVPTWMIALSVFEFKRPFTKGTSTGQTSRAASSSSNRTISIDTHSSRIKATLLKSSPSKRPKMSQTTSKKPRRGKHRKTQGRGPRSHHS
jgi:hypothetical protein